ncbi:MAG TPA: hypothetical protein VIS56_01500 [Candidatus Saccharimonadales bacterium]
MNRELAAQKRLAQILGVIAALLALLGFFVTDGHLFKLMNADTALDILRVPLALALLYAGFSSNNANTIRDILMFTGVAYVTIAILGLLNSELWGLAPSGLTGFDVIFHLLAGILAIATARSGRTERPKSGAEGPMP